MSRAVLAVQFQVVAGLDPTYTAPNGAGAGNGNTFANDGQTVTIHKNLDSGAHVITIPNTTAFKLNGVTQPSITFSIPAGHTALVWAPAPYNDATGQVAMDIDVVTSHTWAAVQIPRSYQ